MLRSEIDDALKGIEQAYGIDINIGSIRFDGISFRGKLEAHVSNTEDGNSFEKVEFDKYCRMYGLTENDYEADVKLTGSPKFGTTGKIVGFKPRSTKYPVLVRTNKGHLVKWTTSILQQVKV